MQPEQIKNMAQQCVQALMDERGMMPTKYSSAIADLKSVLLGLMSGQLIISDAPKQEKPADGE